MPSIMVFSSVDGQYHIINDHKYIHGTDLLEAIELITIQPKDLVKSISLTSGWLHNRSVVAYGGMACMCPENARTQWSDIYTRTGLCQYFGYRTANDHEQKLFCRRYLPGHRWQTGKDGYTENHPHRGIHTLSMRTRIVSLHEQLFR